MWTKRHRHLEKWNGRLTSERKAMPTSLRSFLFLLWNVLKSLTEGKKSKRILRNFCEFNFLFGLKNGGILVQCWHLFNAIVAIQWWRLGTMRNLRNFSRYAVPGMWKCLATHNQNHEWKMLPNSLMMPNCVSRNIAFADQSTKIDVCEWIWFDDLVNIEITSVFVILFCSRSARAIASAKWVTGPALQLWIRNIRVSEIAHWYFDDILNEKWLTLRLDSNATK